LKKELTKEKKTKLKITSNQLCCQMFRVSQADGLAAFNIGQGQKNVKSSELARSKKGENSHRDQFSVTTYDLGGISKRKTDKL